MVQRILPGNDNGKKNSGNNFNPNTLKFICSNFSVDHIFILNDKIDVNHLLEEFQEELIRKKKNKEHEPKSR